MTEFGSSRLWKMAKLNTRRLKSWRWSRSVGEVQASQVWHQLMLKRLKWELIFGLINQGQQGFTPEYVIKNQTKPHLRNYSFLHSHFLTSSQTKLLIPWTFFNVHVSYGIPKIPGKQCWGVVIVVLDHYMQQPWRARWGNKVIEQGRTICSTLTAGDWPIGPCQRISPNPYILFFYEITNNIIPVHRLFLNPRYGERST